MASPDKKDSSELYESLLSDEMFGQNTRYKKDGKTATKQVKSKNIVGQTTTQLSKKSDKTELPSQGLLLIIILILLQSLYYCRWGIIHDGFIFAIMILK